MKSNELIELIKDGGLDGRLLELYVDKESIDYQKNRYISAIKRYEEIFVNQAISKDIEIYSAPGRTEVCGNHTDHQRGKVLAASINLDAIAITSKNNDNAVRIVSGESDMLVVSFDSDDYSKALRADEGEKGTTIGLIRGVLASLYSKGYLIGGFDAYVTSDVLIGAGLSSSAAFEGLIGVIISGLYNDMAIDSSTNAMTGQYAENVYFGKPCGLMDQMACCTGGMVNIDFENKEHPLVRKIDNGLSKAGISVAIVDTKGSHADLTNDYAAIPSEMKSVARAYGYECLRELPEEEFYNKLASHKMELSDRAILRSIHFYDEEKRVDKAAKTLEKGDIDTFLEVIAASGQSSMNYLQNIYSPSDPMVQNISIAIALSQKYLNGHGVCRVHGGGFAGTIQVFVEAKWAKSYKENIEKIFGDNACRLLQIRPEGAVKVI